MLCRVLRRSFHLKAANPQKIEVMNVFDRKAKLLQRERAAINPEVEKYDFLKEEIGYRVADRILDIKREMHTCLDIGSGRGFVTRHITEHSFKKVIALEMSPTMLEQCRGPEDQESVEFEKVLFDEDNQRLPFPDESICLVTSSLSMHWVNNLPGLFGEVKRVLKKDGAFVGAMFGGDTLFELRCSMQLAESEREGGFAAHISPFIQAQDLGSLLDRLGFRMLTIDSDEIIVTYPSVFELMRDLKYMAENNAARNRKGHLGRETLLSTNAIYQEMYGDEEGKFPATFQVYYWIGWKADKSQPKPLPPHQKPDVSLQDLDKIDEIIKNTKKK